MEIAIVGSGRTGSELIELIPKNNILGVFNQSNPPTKEKLEKAEGIIVFVPGSAVEQVIPPVLASKKPTIWGSTGYIWKEDLHNELKKEKVCWVQGSNFSLGMALMKKLVAQLKKGMESFPGVEFSVHDLHHQYKKDAPSGSAKELRDLLPPCEVHSYRVADVVGMHTVIGENQQEALFITHEARDRKVFAQGALWALEKVISKEFNETGLYTFENLVERYL